MQQLAGHRDRAVRIDPRPGPDDPRVGKEPRGARPGSGRVVVGVDSAHAASPGRLSLFLLLAGAPSSGAQSLTPLEIDWAQVFRLEWQVTERDGRALIFGKIYNVSFYGVSRIQLLVDQLDAGGRAVAQQIAWLGFSLQPGEGAFFDVSVPNRDGTYDVRVYALDRKFGEAPNR